MKARIQLNGKLTLAVPCHRQVIATLDPSLVWIMWASPSRTISIISCKTKQQSAQTHNLLF